MNFKQFLGIPPEPATRAGILPGTTTVNPDDLVSSRRDFLKFGVAAVAGSMLPVTDILAEQFQPENKQDLQALSLFLNGKNLTHPNIDNKRIFNDPKILVDKYKNSGNVEYYKPNNPESSKYKKDFLAKAKSYNKNIIDYDDALKDQGYEVVKTHNNTDFAFVAEVEHAGHDSSLYSNGIVVIEKGTKIVRKKNLDGTFKNWIYDCFNPVYAMACMPKRN